MSTFMMGDWGFAEFGRGPDKKPRKRRGLGVAIAAGGGVVIGGTTGGIQARGGLGNNAGLIKTTKMMGKDAFRAREATSVRRKGLKGSSRHAFGQSSAFREIKQIQGQKRAYQNLSRQGIARELSGTTPKGARQIKNLVLHDAIESATKQRISRGVKIGAARGVALGVGGYALKEVWKSRRNRR